MYPYPVSKLQVLRCTKLGNAARQRARFCSGNSKEEDSGCKLITVNDATFLQSTAISAEGRKLGFIECPVCKDAFWHPCTVHEPICSQWEPWSHQAVPDGSTI